jgi:hypothetical protein
VAALLQAGQGLTKTYNDAANSLTLAVTNANLLNKTTIGSFPPSSPAPGDIWFETSDAGGAYVGDTTAGFGQLRHGWYWWWDGSLWRSPRFRWSAFSQNVTVANRFDKWCFLAVPSSAPPGSGGFNVWFQNVRVNFYLQATNNAANHWTLVIRSSTDFATISTATNGPNSVGSVNTVLNTLRLDTELTQPVIAEPRPVGSPSTWTYALSLDYYYVRK